MNPLSKHYGEGKGMIGIFHQSTYNQYLGWKYSCWSYHVDGVNLFFFSQHIWTKGYIVIYCRCYCDCCFHLPINILP